MASVFNISALKDKFQAEPRRFYKEFEALVYQLLVHYSEPGFDLLKLRPYVWVVGIRGPRSPELRDVKSLENTENDRFAYRQEEATYLRSEAAIKRAHQSLTELLGMTMIKMLNNQPAGISEMPIWAVLEGVRLKCGTLLQDDVDILHASLATVLPDETYEQLVVRIAALIAALAPTGRYSTPVECYELLKGIIGRMPGYATLVEQFQFSHESDLHTFDILHEYCLSKKHLVKVPTGYTAQIEPTPIDIREQLSTAWQQGYAYAVHHAVGAREQEDTVGRGGGGRGGRGGRGRGRQQQQQNRGDKYCFRHGRCYHIGANCWEMTEDIALPAGHKDKIGYNSQHLKAIVPCTICRLVGSVKDVE